MAGRYMTEQEGHMAGGCLAMFGALCVVIAVGCFFGWGVAFAALGLVALAAAIAFG